MRPGKSGVCLIPTTYLQLPLLLHNRGMARITELLVNGTRRRIDADSDRTLLGVLRDDLDLTGTKFGCGEGQCAACTVLVGGVATKSCITKLGAVVGKHIVTIEGLATEGKLHPVQQAFLDEDAMQCGYCTPGMILGAVALLGRTPNPTEAEIVSGMNGHICRCGTYPKVVRAIHSVAGKGGRA
jgi:aerobic-type carbon monoxide dehydrogenase small subunit (CoxS/CutS family)